MKKNKNNTYEKLYSLIPDDYTPEEKDEILRTINEYNAICLEILNQGTIYAQEK